MISHLLQRFNGVIRRQLSASSLLLLIGVVCLSTVAPARVSAVEGSSEKGCEPCRQFDHLNSLIRDRRIGPAEARQQLRSILVAVRDHALARGAVAWDRDQWVFPLAGLSAVSAGNPRGVDYVASGYDYFAGNAHGGHPSYDLFIRDRNRDSRDDASGKPVTVLALTGGIVVAREDDWQPGSRLRGGRYLWIYDPFAEALVYYAHNSTLLVRLGDMVRPGDPLALVGRTGLNAFRRRSPTHLHLTYLRVSDGYPRPENIFPDLRRARSRTP